MSRVVERLAQEAGLGDVYARVVDGGRLSYDDGVRLYRFRYTTQDQGEVTEATGMIGLPYPDETPDETPEP